MDIQVRKKIFAPRALVNCERVRILKEQLSTAILCPVLVAGERLYSLQIPNASMGQMNVHAMTNALPGKYMVYDHFIVPFTFSGKSGNYIPNSVLFRETQPKICRYFQKKLYSNLNNCCPMAHTYI
jgi:hypothetical protein